MKFLNWKAEVYAVQPDDTRIIDLNDASKLVELSRKAFHYTKSSIRLFTEFVWQESIKNQLQMEGWPQVPKVSTSPLTFPQFTSRETEVLIMSLFYKNNSLTHYFLPLTERNGHLPTVHVAMKNRLQFIY